MKYQVHCKITTVSLACTFVEAPTKEEAEQIVKDGWEYQDIEFFSDGDNDDITDFEVLSTDEI